MSVRLEVGPQYVDGLALDREPSEFNLQLLRRCLAIADDPDGRYTYAVDIDEGTAVVYQFARNHRGAPEFTIDDNGDKDIVRRAVFVDYVAGDITKTETL